MTINSPKPYCKISYYENLYAALSTPSAHRPSVFRVATILAFVKNIK